LLWGGAGLWAGLSIAGSVPDASTNGLELIPEKPSLWNESLLWDKDITLRAGMGYKDNVLLSADAPRGSPFFISGVDALLFRLPLDGLAFNLTMTGDHVQYWRDIGGVSREDYFLASAKAQKYLGEQWWLGLELTFSYVDQVALGQIESGSFSAVVAKGETLGVQPFVRRDLGTNWWAQLAFPVAWDWFQSPLDDDGRFGAQATLARTYGHGSQVALSYGGSYIAHNVWTNILGDKLAIWRQLAELKWEHRWDKAQHWRSITKLGFQDDQDNGGSYYNYYRYSITEELRFSTKNWEIKASAGLSYYDFPVQPVSQTSPSPTLYLLTPDFTVRAERRVYKTFRLFGEYQYERIRSNQADSQYTYNIFSGGLTWEF
jgi:hypothetical protein